MKKRNIYMIILLVFLIVVSSALWFMNDTRKEKVMIKDILPQAGAIKLIDGASGDPVIQKDFPAIEKIYSIDDKPAAFIACAGGYKS